MNANKKGRRRHYLAVKKLSALLRGIMSKRNIKNLCGNKDFCNVIMTSEDTKLLEFNQYKNLIKHHLLSMYIFNIIEKIDGCKNNPEDSLQQK